MQLTGHRSRAIFDRYNIVREEELHEAGAQLHAYLVAQADRPAGGRSTATTPADVAAAVRWRGRADAVNARGLRAGA